MEGAYLAHRFFLFSRLDTINTDTTLFDLAKGIFSIL